MFLKNIENVTISKKILVNFLITHSDNIFMIFGINHL